MGKRKAAKKQAPKKKLEPLANTFKCVFCHFEKAVTVKLDRQSMFGKLDCRNCGQTFSHPINNLSAAVDVYYDWVDACEDAMRKQPPKKQPIRGPASTETNAVGVDFESRRRVAANEEAEDAEGEDEDEDEDERPAGKETRREPVEDDADEDEDDVDDRADKRRRLADPDEDDDVDD